MCHRSLLGLLSALSIILAHSPPAKACSCGAVVGFHSSMPEDGAVGVPTNVRPWLDGSGEITLFDDRGNVVTSTTQDLAYNAFCRFHRELVVAAPLEANTTYTLVAEDPSGFASTLEDVPTSIRFTTGAGPLEAEPPSPPILRGMFFDASAYATTCGEDRFRGCFPTAEDAGLLDVSAFIAGELHYRVVYPAYGWVSASVGDGPDFCVEVRARDVVGRLSEPFVHCGETAPLPVLERSAEVAGLCAIAEAQLPAPPNEETAGVVSPGDADDGAMATSNERNRSDANGLVGVERSGGCAVVRGARPGGYGILSLGLLLFSLGRRQPRQRVNRG